jgi:hypothetical protein
MSAFSLLKQSGGRIFNLLSYGPDPPIRMPVCAENLIRVDDATESPKLAK